MSTSPDVVAGRHSARVPAPGGCQVSHPTPGHHGGAEVDGPNTERCPIAACQMRPCPCRGFPGTILDGRVLFRLDSANLLTSLWRGKVA
jgi:hypothetical protein